MACHVVEIMFTERCPHLREAIDRVRQATEERTSAAEVEVRLVLVETMRKACELEFLGSPTVRVDGRDVERNSPSTMIGLHGRGYSVDGRVERTPPSDWIVQAL